MSDKVELNTKLEERLAWLDRFVNQLNDVVVDQEKRLEALEARLLKLEKASGSE